MLSFKKDQEETVLKALIMLEEMCQIEIDQHSHTDQYQYWCDEALKVQETIRRFYIERNK